MCIYIMVFLGREAPNFRHILKGLHDLHLVTVYS